MIPSTLNILARALKDFADRTPGLNESRCINLRHLQMGRCSACVDICPVQAVTLEPAPQFDSNACLACDACTVVCPTSALRGHRSPLKVSEDAHESAQGRNVSLACRAVGIGNDMATRIPCISALAPEFYAGLALSGIDQVTVFTAGCEDCPLEPTLSLAQDSIRRAQILLDHFGLDIDVQQQVGQPLENQTTSKQGVSRRGFFTKFVKKQSSSHSEQLEALTDVLGWRHSLLLNELLQHTDTTHKTVLTAQDGDWGDVTIDKRCIGCQMCAQFCPTGALAVTVDETDETVRLWFCAARCVACGLCEKVCFKRAVTLKSEVDLATIMECKFIPLWAGKPTSNPLSNIAKKRESSVMRTFNSGHPETS